MTERDNYTFFKKNARLQRSQINILGKKCNAAVSIYVGNLHSDACLTCPCIKSCLLTDCRRKNFHSVYLKDIFGWAWRPVGEGVWGGRQKKSPFPSGAFLENVERGENSISKIFYQFQTDSRQSLSGYVPACLARARRMAREAAITDPEWRRDQPMAKTIRTPRPITVADKYEDPPLLLLLTRLLTVHWIKQQSELSSSLHWDVGHWLQPIHSGKTTEAWHP